MGRVLKQGQVAGSKFRLTVPSGALPPATTNGVSHGASYDDTPFTEDFTGSSVETFAPEVPPIPEIDWEALHVEAAALLDDASTRAIAVIDDARARAKALIEEAVRSAQTVRDSALADGRAAGMLDGQAAAEVQMEDMLSTMRRIVEMSQVERRKVVESAQPELIRLAMEIAERVIHQQIALDPNVVIEMTKGAISRLVDKETVSVRVNPADLDRVRNHRDEILSITDVKHIHVVEDQRVDRGGVVVETDGGTVDARVQTQVKEARRILHIDDDDDIEIHPHPDTFAAHPQAS